MFHSKGHWNWLLTIASLMQTVKSLTSTTPRNTVQHTAIQRHQRHAVELQSFIAFKDIHCIQRLATTSTTCRWISTTCHWIAVCCTVLHCVALCCTMLHCVTVCCGVSRWWCRVVCDISDHIHTRTTWLPDGQQRGFRAGAPAAWAAAGSLWGGHTRIGGQVLQDSTERYIHIFKKFYNICI